MKIFLSFIILFFPFSLLGQEALQLYVAPGGSNAASGKNPENPFATIERARQEIRTLKQSGNFDKPVTVYLREGVYSLEEPLVFTEKDGGTAQNPITYTNYKDEKAIISGGKTISGWEIYKEDIWMAKIPEEEAGKWQFRQLFVNNQLRQRARMPNEGFYRVKGFPCGGPDIHYHTDCQSFEYAGGDINPGWKNLDDVEVIVYHFWTDSHLPIGSIDEQNNIVTFKHKAGKVFTDDFTDRGARYVVENVWEGLDSPGEWYLDKPTGKLYYIPLPGENMESANVKAPYAPSFMHLKGKPLEQKPVAHLTFKGLNFRFTNFDLPPGNSNDRQGSASVPAGITLEGAQDCEFRDCNITNTGTFGFDVMKGSQNNQISHCNLTHLAAGGIRINGGTEDDHPLLRTGNNKINDNIINHYGEVFPSAVGISIMNGNKNQVVHNEISNGNYTAISVGWEWGYRRSISNHNLIAYNHIFNIGLKGLLSDMGGIYTLGVAPGTVLRNNLIHDISANHYGGWGIYNDEGSTHLLIENNIVHNTKFAPYNIHYSKEVTVRNNIFALGKLEQLSRSRVEPHKSVYFENNIVYWKEGELFNNNWKDRNYEFHVSAIHDPDTLTSTFESDYNLFFNPGKSLNEVSFNGQTFEQWQARGKDIHSKYADPLFVDPENGDFRLQEGSPAFELGFQPIDMTNVGVRDQ